MNSELEFLINQDEGSNLEFKESVSGTLNGTVYDTQKKILKELEKKPNITYDELVERIDTSRRTIIRQMNDLKEKGIVKRVGSDKKGHWEIVERE